MKSLASFFFFVDFILYGIRSQLPKKYVGSFSNDLLYEDDMIIDNTDNIIIWILIKSDLANAML